MGFMRTPKVQPDPALEEQKRAEMARLAKEQQEAEVQRQEKDRKIKQNLLGAKSLQGTDMEGFAGYRDRRKLMGKRST